MLVTRHIASVHVQLERFERGTVPQTIIYIEKGDELEQDYGRDPSLLMNEPLKAGQGSHWQMCLFKGQNTLRNPV
jgi:hypothetical protein